MIAPPAATARVAVSELRAGDVIHAPVRELRLWMREHAERWGLPAEWLTLKVLAVEPSHRSGWLVIVAHQQEKSMGREWRVLARPGTLWPVVSREAEHGT